MKTQMSRDFKSLTMGFSTGLIQLNNHPGGSRTQFALSCLNAFVQSDPPSPTSGTSGYYIFISEGGSLYPPALLEKKVPLSRMLLVKTQEAKETWRAAIEAVQTGLFSWIFLKPSKGCGQGQIRKLRLLADKAKTRVLVFPSERLPHWMFKMNLEISHEHATTDFTKTALPLLSNT